MIPIGRQIIRTGGVGSGGAAINNSATGNPSGTGTPGFLGIPIDYWYIIAIIMIIAAGVVIYVYA